MATGDVVNIAPEGFRTGERSLARFEARMPEAVPFEAPGVAPFETRVGSAFIELNSGSQPQDGVDQASSAQQHSFSQQRQVVSMSFAGVRLMVFAPEQTVWASLLRFCNPPWSTGFIELCDDLSFSIDLDAAWPENGRQSSAQNRKKRIQKVRCR